MDQQTHDDLSGLFRSGRLSTPMGVGPSYFGGSNKLPACVCMETSIVYLAAVVTYLPFLLGVITARSRRTSTFIVGTVTFATFFIILNALFEPLWMSGQANIDSCYCQFNSSMVAEATVGINVGLDHFNITYTTRNHSSSSVNFSFNDRFDLCYGGIVHPEGSHKLRAFKLGLPIPVSTVAEYMESLEWAEKIPAAGYFAKMTLLFALASSILGSVFTVIIPSKGTYFFLSTGALLAASAGLYFHITTLKLIYVDGVALRLHLGRTFVTVAVTAAANMMCGIVILMLRKARCLNTVSTFLEVDYDTPWDNKIIKEGSKLAASTTTAGALTTQLYVDSRLRGSVRRFRQSLISKRRSKSHDYARTESTTAIFESVEEGERKEEEAEDSEEEFLRPVMLLGGSGGGIK